MISSTVMICEAAPFPVCGRPGFSDDHDLTRVQAPVMLAATRVSLLNACSLAEHQAAF
jgi:hypothetical protein